MFLIIEAGSEIKFVNKLKIDNILQWFDNWDKENYIIDLYEKKRFMGVELKADVDPDQLEKSDGDCHLTLDDIKELIWDSELIPTEI